jgi:hypothetical protein
MTAKLTIGFVLFALAVACRKEPLQSIEFVKRGVPQNLEIHDMHPEDGYLQADETFSLKMSMAIYGTYL